MDNYGYLNLDQYKKLQKLGDGSFGEVFLVEEKDTRKKYAAKIGFKSLDEVSKESLINLTREVNLLSQLNHPSILKFIGFSPYNFEKKFKPIIITEYSPNGSLYDLIELERNKNAPNGWNATKKLINIYGIANAMAYLHSYNIVHRDLKPQNILEDEFLFPKIGDFGLSKIYHQNQESMTLQSTIGIKGTPVYIAPEIWKTNQYTKEGDVYAFSFIIYEIMTNKQPFNDYSSYEFAIEVISKNKRPELNQNIPGVYMKLIEKCWDENPEKRPTFDQIVCDLKNNADFITNEVDKNDFFDYVRYVDQFQKSFVSQKVILSIEDILNKRPTKLLEKTTINKNSARTNKEEGKEINKIDRKTPKNFYEELTMNKSFLKLKSEAQKFFRYLISPETTEKSIILNQNNLNALLTSLESPYFIDVLKLFDKIIIEIKYPSSNFQRIFNSLTNIKNNNLEKIQVNLTISTREINFILGNNKTLNTVKIGPVVKIIGDSAFKGCQLLKEIDFPPSVTKISELAFSGCEMLEEVIIPPSITYIGTAAFKCCTSLKQITINPLKTFVETSAFQECKNLNSMILCSEDTNIYPFNNESFQSITKISIPISITKIKENSFKQYNSVKEISIPSSVLEIENGAFNGCQSLEKINLPQINKLEKCLFYGCSSLKKLEIPSTITVIECFSLFGCISLEEITLPSSVILIERYSFSNCSSLINVNFSDKLTVINEGAFKGCISLKEIVLPASLEKIDNRVFEGCTNLKKITFPDEIKILGEYIFSGCCSLENVSFPKKLNSIPVGFLYQCSSIAEFELSNIDYLTTICENSFRDCASLKQINIPETVKIIEENAFNGCKSLINIEIPQFLASISESAFMNCTSLEKVTFSKDALTSIEDHCFDGCISLKEIDIPSSVSIIHEYAFSGCKSLHKIVIPEYVNLIEPNAFLNCSSLADLQISSTSTKICDDCFKGCASLNIKYAIK